MAHKDGHRNVTAWIPDDEAQALERLARQNERSLAAEFRVAVRRHLRDHNHDGSARISSPVLRQEVETA